MSYKHEFRAMGCRMLGIVERDDGILPLQSMPALLEQWEQILSRFRSDSELCELNRSAGETVPVSKVLWDVFEASRQAEIETRGLVNPLVTQALVSAGYDRTFDEVRARIDDFGFTLDPRPVPALRDVEINAMDRSLRLPPGAGLDFGGIAKGWAAEQAMTALSAYGPALFSAGGDIAVSGPRADGGAWEISVDDPFHQGASLSSIYLEGGAVATSGKDYRHWVRGGLSRHHIIDTRTGLPAETDVLTATIVAPDAMLAEAFAKAILIVGSDAGLAWLESDDRLAGLLVLENGQLLSSRRLQDYL